MPDCIKDNECPWDPQMGDPMSCVLIKILDIIGKGYVNDH